MNRTPEQIAGACALGPVKALELLDRGRTGDLGALKDWSVYALYRQFLRVGASPVAALHHTKIALDNIDLTAKVAG